MSNLTNSAEVTASSTLHFKHSPQSEAKEMPSSSSDMKLKRTEGWIRLSERKILYLNRYEIPGGGPTPFQYRLDSNAESSDYESAKPEADNLNTSFNFTGDVRAIYAIVWTDLGANNWSRDLELLNPQKIMERKLLLKSKKLHDIKVSLTGFPLTFVNIGVEYNGEKQKRWMDREALYALKIFGERLHKIIFQTAMKQEQKRLSLAA
jgi:hypothetical protein